MTQRRKTAQHAKLCARGRRSRDSRATLVCEEQRRKQQPTADKQEARKGKKAARQLRVRSRCFARRAAPLRGAQRPLRYGFSESVRKRRQAVRGAHTPVIRLEFAHLRDAWNIRNSSVLRVASAEHFRGCAVRRRFGSAYTWFAYGHRENSAIDVLMMPCYYVVKPGRYCRITFS
jgi:hypothetical protein